MMKLRPRLDISRITKESELLGESLIHRGDPFGREKVANLLKLQAARLDCQSKVDNLNANRNRGLSIDKSLLSLEKNNLHQAEEEYYKFALQFPNWTHPDVPIGDESKAKIIKESSTKIEVKEFDHLQICEKNDLTDFAKATKTTGSKFVFLKREAAILEMSLQQLAMKNLLKENFIPISTPDLVHPYLIEACGFQPRVKDSQVYHIEDHELCLIGTSEIALAGYLSQTKLKNEQRLLGISHCFRTEAGTTGKDAKGLYRLHQFSKVEMFLACHPARSEESHLQLVNYSTKLCDQLGLMWRVLDMPTLELGNSAYRKYDVEVFMPGSRRWGEVASITNTQDYQSRRLDIKYENDFAHTLNGTACAVPRILLALLETHQNSDKSVNLPSAIAELAGFDVIRRD